MKAYSLDLRQKVVDAYACGDISQRKLAKNFGVTLSFVQNLLKALNMAFAEVTIENLLGWFTHCCYCTSED
ncbi:hypothetical protein KBT16_18875 [Nostoc sp. CCCryo 231-06]|nr:hypothetical protein [Nostoc sp. CCCryo 231-06]